MALGLYGEPNLEMHPPNIDKVFLNKADRLRGPETTFVPMLSCDNIHGLAMHPAVLT